MKEINYGVTLTVSLNCGFGYREMVEFPII